MNLRDLIVLAYSQNECYTSILSIEDAEKQYKQCGFSVDANNETWSFNKQSYKIASSRSCNRGSRWGVIGVYNRNNNRHLDRMIRASQEATSSQSYNGDL